MKAKRKRVRTWKGCRDCRVLELQAFGRVQVIGDAALTERLERERSSGCTNLSAQERNKAKLQLERERIYGLKDRRVFFCSLRLVDEVVNGIEKAARASGLVSRRGSWTISSSEMGFPGPDFAAEAAKRIRERVERQTDLCAAAAIDAPPDLKFSFYGRPDLHSRPFPLFLIPTLEGL